MKAESRRSPGSDLRKPFVSVVIPVFNDRRGLARCLDRLGEQTYPGERTEILVIDNGSRESPADLLTDRKNARLLHETGIGSYAARNRGISEAGGEIVAFTDADCLPEADWLSRGVARILAEDDIGLVGGRIKVLCSHPTRPGPCEILDSTISFRQELYVEKCRFAATANLFTFKKVLDQVGDFDAGLRSGGDGEWGRRVDAAGFRLIYAPEVCVGHPTRKTFAEVLEKQLRLVGGSVALQQKGTLLLKAPLVEIVESILSTRDLLAAGEYPVGRRMQAIGLRYLLAFFRLGEHYRLIAGGKPLR